MTRVIATVIIVATTLVPIAAFGQSGDRDCSDFRSWAEAQRFYESQGSGDQPYMPAVAWAYPEQPAAQRRPIPAAPVIPAATARNYRYGLSGDAPPWRPLSVYDDGRRVYVEFPRGVVQGEMPPISVIGANGEPEIVNNRVHQNILIVDRLFGAAELRLGSGDHMQTVRIVRTDGTSQSAAQPGGDPT